ncbi:TRAF3-interacting protein 1-like [Tetranychus urticae]|uniref:TRAF3-interacting protein 1 n=1 Tax=Tetranychus urticae TaxID=32264 RepID=T1KHP6_TETUR|nr:TRAF3-interacting protein 1-like [Tetranychus urticae]
MATNQVNVDPKIIKNTQDTLGKIIKKPVLTEKLLKRPPFKFLHDIIINVINSTGYMKEVFDSDDLNPSIQKDKDGKIDFLQKVIDNVGSTLKKPVDVKAAKIVAGLEPDKTNQFLQSLAKAAIAYGRGKKESPSTPKSTVKNVNKPPINQRPTGVKATANTSQSGSKGKKSSTVTNEQSTINKNGGEISKIHDQSTVKSSVIPNEINNEPGTSKPSEESDEMEDINGGDNDNPNGNLKGRTKSASENINRNQGKIKDDNKMNDNNDDPGESKQENDDSTDDPGENDALEGIQNDNQKGLPQLVVRPPTGTQKAYSPRASPRPSARPTTARAAPPKVVSKRELQDSPGTDQSHIIQSSKPVENLISEKRRPGTALGRKSVLGNAVEPTEDFGNLGNSSNEDEDDEDAMFVVQEIKDDISGSIESSALLQAHSTVNGEDKSKGSLVKQLVETKVALEGSNADSKQQTPFDTPGLHNRLASRDINKLRENIQRLTQLATPLGRILDYLQEDINAIVIELRSWVDEHSRNMAKLKEEKSSIDTHLEPLRIQLEHFDGDIARLRESISVKRVAILKNEEKIERIVKMAVEKA